MRHIGINHVTVEEKYDYVSITYNLWSDLGGMTKGLEHSCTSTSLVLAVSLAKIMLEPSPLWDVKKGAKTTLNSSPRIQICPNIS